MTTIPIPLQRSFIAPMCWSSRPKENSKKCMPGASATVWEKPFSPTTGELWCSANERDALGNNLVPDYITHVQEDGFYGWPWYYMGGHQDPRQAGKHPELKSKVIVPDVLLNPHLASLEVAVL